MSKPKRNDPCSCGSGKKYKKCCGLNKVVEISPALYNVELDRLHEDLIHFAIDNYEEEMDKVFGEHLKPFQGSDVDMTETYHAGLTLWTILNVPLFEGNQTIFDVFYNKRQAKIKHTRTRKIFAEWGNAEPAAYEVLSVGENTETLKSMLTGKTYATPFSEESNDLAAGNIAIGILIPYVQHYVFFLTAIEIDGDIKPEISVLMESFAGMDGTLKDNFPDFLGDVLMSGPDITMEWNNPLHKMVADHFSRHMSEKGFDDEVITAGVLLWNVYCLKKNPTFKKLGPYAAATEYLLYDTFYEESPYTQEELAKEYETTAGTVSTNFRKLSRALATEIEEVRETVLDDENDDDIYPDAPTGNPFGMEREMNAIQKALESQDFASEAEMNAFLDDLLNNGSFVSPPPESPRDLAQDKFYEAVEVEGKKRQKLLQEALDIYPNSPDIYLLMAEDAKSMLEHRKLVSKAVKAGEADLGKQFFLENKGYFWGLTETRPYMRAKAAYANILYTEGNMKEALEQYEALLELNPDDNQGIRYILLPCYIEAEKWKKAEQLINQYDDASASFAFDKALVHYLTNGMTSKTKSLIKAANKQNPYVKDYLLGKKSIPKQQPDYIGIGDEREAIAYAQEHMHLWKDKDALLEALK